jgi:hypothetical protein
MLKKCKIFVCESEFAFEILSLINKFDRISDKFGFNPKGDKN